MRQTNTYDAWLERVEGFGTLLYPPDENQILLRVDEREKLLQLVETLSSPRDGGEKPFFLVTVVANDERELEDHCFKIYYVFSHAREDVFLIVEYLLSGEEYPSIAPHFPAVERFQAEMADLMGLYPEGRRDRGWGEWLHTPPYPPGFHPLRRDVSLTELRRRMAEVGDRTPGPGRDVVWEPAEGHHILPVGPIHAGLIEPGRFLFEIGGEVIEKVRFRLGYTHKGVERLFQSAYTLVDGWRLAEQVTGDSSFAHSLAYTHAVETLFHVTVPEPAVWMRGILLELERVYNHVTDMAALAHDVALDAYANELALQRERLLRLNEALTGNRFLRGVNRVGGVRLPRPPDADGLRSALGEVRAAVEPVIRTLSRLEGFRDRSVNIGVLTREDALALDVTGLVARASGVERDYRLNHPWGIYEDPELRQMIRMSDENVRAARLPQELHRGDVHARFLVRAWEFLTSTRIVDMLLERWRREGVSGAAWLADVPPPDSAADYAFALGYAEGWRGDIVYWVMQDKLGSIYRCKVRDPSMLNWPALVRALEPHEHQGRRLTTILPDFPLINKSFNLSYTGHDL